MKNSKAYWFLCICFLSLLLLAGCHRTTGFNDSMAANGQGFTMEYSHLNQEKRCDLSLTEGSRLRLEYAHTEGSVDITVGQDGKTPIYTGTNQVEAAFDLVIPESGVYHISVTGRQAKGRVSFICIPLDTGKE